MATETVPAPVEAVRPAPAADERRPSDAGRRERVVFLAAAAVVLLARGQRVPARMEAPA